MGDEKRRLGCLKGGTLKLFRDISYWFYWPNDGGWNLGYVVSFLNYFLMLCSGLLPTLTTGSFWKHFLIEAFAKPIELIYEQMNLITPYDLCLQSLVETLVVGLCLWSYHWLWRRSFEQSKGVSHHPVVVLFFTTNEPLAYHSRAEFASASCHQASAWWEDSKGEHSFSRPVGVRCWTIQSRTL